MQGIFMQGYGRPKSKKQVKEAVAAGDTVYAEATSMFGNEYDGPVADMPEGTTIYFVGPDPHTKRNFYGQITRKGDKVVVK
jgi:hypothetical protein